MKLEPQIIADSVAIGHELGRTLIVFGLALLIASAVIAIDQFFGKFYRPLAWFALVLGFVLALVMIVVAVASDADACSANFAGLASYYSRGDGHSGARTATGEAFDDTLLTAAHRCLPFGTMLRVSWRGRSIVVRVNDRGPFVPGRVLDLSRGAAIELGLAAPGAKGARLAGPGIGFVAVAPAGRLE